MAERLDVRTALLQGQQLLKNAGISSPRFTAELLLMHATGQERAWLYAHSTDELKEVWWIHYGRYLHERIKGKPTQHITGHQEFYGREFRVTSDVLIPRPETEHLIEAALPLIRPGDRVLDIGTGSGAIAVTLALETQARVYASDFSEAAVHVARLNAQALGARVDLIRGDLTSFLRDRSFDLIVSNPPYVAERDRDTLQHEVRDHEPALALFGGTDGLAIYRRLIPEAARVLKPGGGLLLELGDAASVRQMLDGWCEVQVLDDLAGIPRIVVARKDLA